MVPLIDSFFIMDPRITGLKDCVSLLKYLLQVHMLDIYYMMLEILGT